MCLYRTRGWLAGWLALRRRHSVAEAGGGRWRRAVVSAEAKSLFRRKLGSVSTPAGLSSAGLCCVCSCVDRLDDV